ncbi:MAG: tRNA (adenosine(37)-N6)-threonylcarbamoyltransferase complex dimerization subunit type 1 TsaB [Bacteroidetes bacterium]|nr:MAG: tRNA (adenosine(37)-N6)-threonylcarbamoyltransferase complex dimerization subunit type 1 TsaB [Bacteroidota bacterium]
MATILCIETSTNVCSVALSRDGHLLAVRDISEGYLHAEKLLPFVLEVISESAVQKKEIQAVAVSSGPGSYTGLRIGVSTAKGLCYALDIPLVSISTLQALAWKVKQDLMLKELNPTESVLFCPMIDARRMEVYTALYDSNLKEVMKVSAEVMEPTTFADYFKSHTIYFTGDGADKCKALFAEQKKAAFDLQSPATASAMCALAENAYIKGHFENLALFEPFYLKEYKAGKSGSVD